MHIRFRRAVLAGGLLLAAAGGCSMRRGGMDGSDNVGPADSIHVDSVAALREAIRTAPAGARVSVAPGEYVLEASVDVARDDIVIEGAGDATLFKLAEGARCPVFVIGEPTPERPAVTHRRVTLRAMHIRGYRSAHPTPEDELCSVAGREHLRNNGITVRHAADCVIEDVRIENVASGGIVLEQVCRNIRIRRVESYQNEFDGIAWDGDIRDSLISGCTLRNNKGAGLSFDIGPAHNRIQNCVIRNNVAVGVFMRDSDDNCFVNCTIEGNGEDGVFIADGDGADADTTGNAFVDNVCRNNARNGIWQAGQRSSGNCERGGTFSGNGGEKIQQSFPGKAPVLKCSRDNACVD